ncbi:type II toxin-antitoxin system HicB family antitoxin [Candidatus Parcubacteria bacterium]|nr:type II toxin-antitoxin system HicB family antitoxin [Candidatus Parcubacteria bacterium]
MEKYIADYRVVIEPDEELSTGKPGFTAYVPKLGIADSGYTVEEALANVTEGISCWIEALLSDGVPIPTPRPR